MAIRTLSLSTLFIYTPRPRGQWGGYYVLSFDPLEKYKDDTFIVIFSPGTILWLQKFEKVSDKYKVLFRNKKKAINTIHGTEPRNTVIVFELV